MSRSNLQVTPEGSDTLKEMNPALLSWGPVAVIVGGYLLGIYFQNRSTAHLGTRIDDLKTEMNHRLSDVNSRLGDMNNRISDLKDFVHSEVRRVEDRIERLERPVLRP
jgi:hypothetical protein